MYIASRISRKSKTADKNLSYKSCRVLSNALHNNIYLKPLKNCQEYNN